MSNPLSSYIGRILQKSSKRGVPRIKPKKLTFDKKNNGIKKKLEERV